METTEPTIPRPLSKLEQFVHDWPVNEIRLHYEQTGCDTAESYVTLRSHAWGGLGEKKAAEIRVVQFEFDTAVRGGWFDFRMDHATMVRPTDKLRALAVDRKKFETTDAHDIREYRRLFEKFGGRAP